MTNKDNIEENTLETVVEIIKKRMAKGSDNSHSIGTGTFINPLDEMIIKEELTKVLTKQSTLHQREIGEIKEEVEKWVKGEDVWDERQTNQFAKGALKARKTMTDKVLAVINSKLTK